MADANESSTVDSVSELHRVEQDRDIESNAPKENPNADELISAETNVDCVEDDNNGTSNSQDLPSIGKEVIKHMKGEITDIPEVDPNLQRDQPKPDQDVKPDIRQCRDEVSLQEECSSMEGNQGQVKEEIREAAESSGKIMENSEDTKDEIDGEDCSSDADFFHEEESTDAKNLEKLSTVLVHNTNIPDVSSTSLNLVEKDQDVAVDKDQDVAVGKDQDVAIEISVVDDSAVEGKESPSLSDIPAIVQTPREDELNTPSDLQDSHTNQSINTGTDSATSEPSDPSNINSSSHDAQRTCNDEALDTVLEEPDLSECGSLTSTGDSESGTQQKHQSQASTSSTEHTQENMRNSTEVASTITGSNPTSSASRPVKPQEKGLSFRDSLRHLKQNIKSATKESSPIREALGQMKQGLKSAISETSTFLEGPTPPGTRPIPLHHNSSAANQANGQAHRPHAGNGPIPQKPLQSGTVHANGITVRPPAESKPEAVTVMDFIPADITHVKDTVPRAVGCAADAASTTDTASDVVLSEPDTEPEQDLSSMTTTSDQLSTAESDSAHSTPPPPRPPPPNGVRKFTLTEIPEYKELVAKCEQLKRDLHEQQDQNSRLKSVHEAQDSALVNAKREAEMYRKLVDEFKSKTSEDIYLAQIKALETTIANQQKDIKTGKEQLDLQDRAAKDAVAKLQAELKAKSEQLTSANEAAKKEKQDMVLKYARAESKSIEMEQRMAKNDTKMKEFTKEREALLAKFKTLKADQTKCRELFETRSTEVLQLRRELQNQRELMVSQEGKTKWAHNKLKMEIDSHKETKAKLEETLRKNKASRDEAEQIRRDCQSMIRTYQESEEIKSNSLDHELKVKETELMQQKQEKMDQDEIHQLLKRELETLKMKHKEMVEELKTWRDKKTCLDAERIIQEENLNKYRETLQKQKETNQLLEKRLADLEDIEKIVIEVEEKNSELMRRNEDVEQEVAEARIDMDKCSTREQEHLVFTQKISDKNAHLQSENTALHNKVIGFTAENERLNELCESLKTKKDALEKELATEKKLRTKEVVELSKEVKEKTSEVERLTTELDDLQSEIKTLKRKHAANTKDLTRQLQSAKRKMDSLEPNKDKDVSSMGSRTSSNGSLDTMNNGLARSASSTSQPPAEGEPFVEIVEVDKQMLIEKIVRLQKAHARKNEKLEFMEDHIQQLFTEVQKKTKIIQNYALREEAGALSSENTDTNKALLAKKGGIMASLYTSHPQDGAMTLDFSLDINRKLQAVLEDTLLKNITLKENLDTLGEEIARLSQENRAIKLSTHPLT